MQQVVLHALALAPARATAFLFLDLLQLALEQVVDHRRRQDLVLTAHGQPQMFGDAVGEQFLLLAAERRDEAARIHFQRADRLQQGVRQQGVDFGKIGGSRETEERQVAEEHGIPDGKEEGRPTLNGGRLGICVGVGRGAGQPGMGVGQRRVVATAQRHEVEQGGIGQLRGPHFAHGTRDLLDAARVVLLPLPEHQADLAARQVLLAAAQVAGNDRELARLRVVDDVALAHNVATMSSR
ncbi:hypothetical protein G6F32_013985 [Rhizopus arrhizus]|nr:hypothetical protein G6F32_013985 [Rhizopus arrhizus]